jgi:hypothetical protein
VVRTTAALGVVEQVRRQSGISQARGSRVAAGEEVHPDLCQPTNRQAKWAGARFYLGGCRVLSGIPIEISRSS